MPADMQAQAARIAKGLYNGSITSGTIDQALTKLVAAELRKAVIEGFGQDFPQVNYGTPDHAMLASLEKNIFHFSAAKTYQTLQSMSAALRDENGLLRSFADFKAEALKIAEVFNGKYLRTEYETAIGSGQMAGKWVDFEKNKETAPFLRYDTAGDRRVRESHRVLDGVIKKVEDPFWSMYYPPNGWGCRCDVTQLIHGEETPADRIVTPNDVPAIFQTNLAKAGQVFPGNHPYYIGLPPHLLKKAEALREAQYSLAYKSKTGATVHVSTMADKKDLPSNLQNATRLADMGESVRIAPHVMEQKVKNPELELYDGHKGDFKEPQPKKSFKNSYEKQIKNASDQTAEIPVLVLHERNYNRLEMIRAFNNGEMWQQAPNVVEVWLLLEKQLVKFTRQEIIEKHYISRLP